MKNRIRNLQTRCPAPLIFPFFFILAFYILQQHGPAQAGHEVFRNSLAMEFVKIPAGTFLMGSPGSEAHRSPNEDQHRVTLTRPFYLQTTEVTVKQWRAVMGKRFFFRKKGSEDMPVVRVSWFDCMDFIKKLNARKEGFYRLPTEAEWEYACRAGSKKAYAWGKSLGCDEAMYANSKGDYDRCMEQAKSRGLSPGRPAPVKSYPPNSWGLYDMHGNVWEWCQDWWGKYPTHPAVNPLGPNFGYEKVRRGGSWYGPAWSCRCANRAKAHPASRFRTTGFRLVWSKTPEKAHVTEPRRGMGREEGGP